MAVPAAIAIAMVTVLGAGVTMMNTVTVEKVLTTAIVLGFVVVVVMNTAPAETTSKVLLCFAFQSCSRTVACTVVCLDICSRC